MRRLIETAAALLLYLAGAIGTEAHAAPTAPATPTIFGAPETDAESHEALPQWRRVLRSLYMEEQLYAGCAHGDCPSRAVGEWVTLLAKLAGEPRAEQLRAVNFFVNRSPYRSDHAAYGRRDHWATPLEFFRKSGDCEDYAIAKYVSLRRLGLPAADLRMVVLQDTSRDIAHAVLIARQGDTWLVLDNLSDRVERPERLPHYIPYYSVNETARWTHTSPDAAVVTSGLTQEPATRPTPARRR